MKYPMPKKMSNPITGEKKPQKSKYKNKKVLIDGIWFDSEKEGKRYQELKLLEKAGEIKELQMQTPFLLQPSFKLNGKTIQAIKYKADFTYWKPLKDEWILVVEDVKGMKTDIYKMKAKMFAYRFDFEISEV